MSDTKVLWEVYFRSGLNIFDLLGLEHLGLVIRTRLGCRATLFSIKIRSLSKKQISS